MEKLTFTALISLIAVLITSIITIVKLVVEKENKTSDFRQEWTKSLRTALAEFYANSNAFTAAVSYQVRILRIADRTQERLDKATEPKKIEFYMARIKAGEERLGEVQKSLREFRAEEFKNIALLKLHFKPEDSNILKINSLFNAIVSLRNDFNKMTKREEHDNCKVACREIADRIVDIGSLVLKSEWERVKEGEPLFKTTKEWSLNSIYFLVPAILVIIFVLIPQNNTNDVSSQIHDENRKNTLGSIVTNSKYCWKMQLLKSNIYMFNSCNGEVKEYSF